MTPQGFVQRIRVAHAAHLLETTRASVEESPRAWATQTRPRFAESFASTPVYRRENSA